MPNREQRSGIHEQWRSDAGLLLLRRSEEGSTPFISAVQAETCALPAKYLD